MKTLGIVTARGGSKGIPRKNLKLLGGKPLLWHTLQSAASSGAFDRVILSTDDLDIANYARTEGCEVPFLRPAELARDTTPHLPVIQHAVSWMKDNDGYVPDAVMILQPTSPLRRTEDIREALRLLRDTGADSVVSVSAVSAHANPMRMLRVTESGDAVLFVNGEPVRRRINRRQDLPTAWVMNGAVYALRPAVLSAADPSLYGDRTVVLPIPAPYDMSLDDREDWETAERALAAEVTHMPGRVRGPQGSR